MLMLVGVLGFLEAAGAVLYYAAIPAERRKVAEVALGLRGHDFNAVLRYRPHPYFNYIGNPDYVTPEGRRLHHQLGIRATDINLRDKPAGALRLVALGGSTTFGLYVEETADAWPGILGEALGGRFGSRVEVVNAGVPNHSTYEMLPVAAMLLPELEADIVLVHTGLNDAFTVAFPDEGGPDNTTFRHSWTHRPLPGPVGASMRASYFVRAALANWLIHSGYAVGDMTPAMQHPAPPEDEILRNAEQATGKYFRRNLETLITLIRHTGAQPVLVNMPINPRFEETDSVYYEAISQAVVRNNRIMSAVGNEYDVPVVDLYPRMRDPEIYIDAAHVGEAGMVLKAALVLETLQPIVASVLDTPGAADETLEVTGLLPPSE